MCLPPIKLSLIHIPVEATLEIVGGKYKPLILWHLSGKTLRFGQLQKLLSSATPKMLTKQLRELENDGLIARKVYPVVPPKVEYSLTPLGTSFIPILSSICDWGNNYLKVKDVYKRQIIPSLYTAFTAGTAHCGIVSLSVKSSFTSSYF